MDGFAKEVLATAASQQWMQWSSLQIIEVSGTYSEVMMGVACLPTATTIITWLPGYCKGSNLELGPALQKPQTPKQPRYSCRILPNLPGQARLL